MLQHSKIIDCLVKDDKFAAYEWLFVWRILIIFLHEYILKWVEHTSIWLIFWLLISLVFFFTCQTNYLSNKWPVQVQPYCLHMVPLLDFVFMLEGLESRQWFSCEPKNKFSDSIGHLVMI